MLAATLNESQLKQSPYLEHIEVEHIYDMTWEYQTEDLATLNSTLNENVLKRRKFQKHDVKFYRYWKKCR